MIAQFLLFSLRLSCNRLDWFSYC